MSASPPFGTYVSPRSRARVTKGLLIAGAIVSVVSMGVSALELVFPTLSPEDELENNPGGAIMALLQFGVASLQGLIYLITVVVFLMWLHRAHKNLVAFGTPFQHITYSPGWAIGSFFIPFANLVVPYRAMKELWRNSWPSDDFSGSSSPPSTFPVWWGFWLLSNFASNLYFRASLREGTPRELLAVGGVVADALTIMAAIFAIMVVEEITRRQEETSSSMALDRSQNRPPQPPIFEQSYPAPKDSSSSEFNL